MSQPTSTLQAVLTAAARAQAELARRVFHLKTLYETAGELAPLTQPHLIMGRFLLTAMGMAGVTRALVVLINRQTGQGWLSQRGLAPEESERVERQLPQLAAFHFPVDAYPAAGARAAAPEAAGDEVLPADTQLLIRETVDGPYVVLAAFGACLSGGSLDEADRTALLNLMGVMLNALRQNLFHQESHRLHAGLARQAGELEIARSLAGLAHARLDRQVFSLRTMYEFTAGSSGVLSSKALLQRLLLTVMGVTGSAAGSVLLCDRSGHRVTHIGRGCGPERTWTHEDAERQLYRAFQAAEPRRLDPMSSSFVQRPEDVFTAAEVGFEACRAVIFTVDEGLIGLLALGAPLRPAGSPETECELLQGLTASCMVLLRNARAFETIQALNVELRHSNDDLRRTVAELTEAHRQIRILEVAKSRLRQAIQREVDQAGRLRLRDLLVMAVLAAGLAFAFNAANPNGVPVLQAFETHEPLPGIGAEVAHRLLEEGQAVLVDARPPELYQAERIPQAINIPAPLFDVIFPMQLGHMLKDGQTVVVYGRTVSRRYDEEVARRVLQRTDLVTLLQGGIDAWREKGYPVTP
ncbi:MAG TPA: rhodanese-like domain-containing protein [Bryobacteraceae bacterium]|nr:rhodanese-like domain-containing protein [Bryobacteraceae bacterium]